MKSQTKGRLDANLSITWRQEAAIDDSLQSCRPAIDDSRLYLGDLSGTFYALSRRDGSVEWTQERAGALSDSSPCLHDGAVYVGSGGGAVHAFDAVDGTERWSYTGPSAVSSSPVVANGTVYVGRNDGIVLALDAADGTVRWQVDVGDAVRSEVAYSRTAEAVIVSTTDGRVCARAAVSGDELWSRSFGAVVGSSSPVVDDDRGLVYFAADELFTVDVETGETVWGTSFYGANAGSSPAFDDEYVYVAGGDGKVYAVAHPDGPLAAAPAWEFETWDVSIAADLTVIDGRILVCSLDGVLYVLDADSGAAFTDATVECRLRASPAVADETVFLAGAAGTVRRVE